MKLKQLYARFRDWQRNPFHFKPMVREAHRCLSCGHEFEGNFCPNCGQKSDTGRLGWHSVFAKMFDVWDVEKNSLPTTLLHLLTRPGYMICDYLDGRRRPYYSPVMLVFILAIVDAIVESFVGVPDSKTSSEFFSTSITSFRAWCEQNEGWSYVIHNLGLLLPTWLLFRYSPRHPRHTLPETFFILTFISALLQFLEVMGDAFGNSFRVFQILFMPFILMFCYGPVFGYGVWGTLWRFFLCSLAGVQLILLSGIAVDIVMGYPYSKVVGYQMLIVAGITIVLLAVITLINRYGEQRRKAKEKGSQAADTGWKTQFIEPKQGSKTSEKQSKQHKSMNQELIEQRCHEHEQVLLDRYFGNLVKEAAIERPETIGEYTQDLPLKIETEYKAFLAGLWEEWKGHQSADDARTIDDILDKQQLRQQMTKNDRDAIARAHREAERRTLWERITRSNHKDVTFYKGLLMEYTRDLLYVMREDFLEEVKGRDIEGKPC